MSYKILIVDDEKMLTEMLADHFEIEGYAPVTANSAKEALDKLSCNPDIILRVQRAFSRSSAPALP